MIDRGDTKNGFPNHQTALLSNFSSGNTWHYYLSRETTENRSDSEVNYGYRCVYCKETFYPKISRNE